MSQRTYLGARPTLLDVAKDAIEKFLKVSISLVIRLTDVIGCVRLESANIIIVFPFLQK